MPAFSATDIPMRALQGERAAPAPLGALPRVSRGPADALCAFASPRARSMPAPASAAALFEDVAQALDDVLWVYEPLRRRFVYVSPAYELRWRRSAAALYADAGRWLEPTHRDDLVRVGQAFDALPHSRSHDIEYRTMTRAGGICWIAERARALPRHAGEDLRIAGISQDITLRMTAELAAGAAARRKDEFLAMLAHELRNPLQPIRFAAFALAAPGTAESRRDALGVVERQVGHMTRLIEDLSDLSRIIHGKLRLRAGPVTLADPIAAALDICRDRIERSDVHLQLGPAAERDVRVHADPARLTQVFSNLIDNATKFSRPGGAIELRVRRDADAHAVSVSVRDEGAGIAAELLPSVFELFRQGENTLAYGRDGLGIGLAIVRGITELHGGRVEVFSAGQGKGSEFVVRLPMGGSSQVERVDPAR